MKRNEMPVFGNMQGVRVVGTGTSIAGPVACSLFAEQGADVIQIESTVARDMVRSIGDIWTAEHRNNRTIALNIRSAEGEEVLKKLLAESDILIEGSKGGTWDKWGLSDELLWSINPALVIVHISGYGQTGDPDYVNRGSYDPIGQAFSGFMVVQGEPAPRPPVPVKPYTFDYITAVFASWSAAVALLRARQTGKGEQAPRMGIYGNSVCALPNVQICGDGNYVMTAIGGNANFIKLEKLLGLEGDPDFAEPHAVINKADGPRAEKIVAGMNKFCMARTAQQVNDELNALKLPCSVIMTYEMMKQNSHYQARGTFTTWHDDNKDKDIMGVNSVPFFKNNPSQIFRGGPVYGADNEDILSELGYDGAQIAAMYDRQVIKK